jgi:hypothetical protein
MTLSIAIALVAAVIALWSIFVARNANQIAKKSLKTQELALPPAWSVALRGDNSKVSFENNSGRHIVVERVSFEPDAAKGLLSLQHPLPTRIEYGDLFSVYSTGRFGMAVSKLTLGWRYEDEEALHETERLL